MKKSFTLLTLLLSLYSSIYAQWTDLNFQVENPQASYTFYKLSVSDNGKNIAAWGTKLVIIPFSNTNFWAISSNYGATWKEVVAQKNSPDNLFWVDDVLYCQDSLSLKKSTDFGATFTVQKANLFSFGVAKPIFKVSNNNWLIIQGIGATSTQEQSTDQGITWSPKGTITAAAIPIPFSTLVAKNGNYVSTSSGETVYSTDLGMSWQRGTYPPSTFLPGSALNTLSKADNGDLAYSVPIFDLLYKSTDNGVTWTKVEGNRPTSARCMYLGNKLIAIANDGSTHVSEDGGAVFTKSSDPTIVSNGSLCSSSKNLFTTRDKKIYRYGTAPTGVNEQRNNTLSLKIFPNPVSSMIQFNFAQSVLVQNVVILNMNGQKVKEVTEASAIDVSELPNGLYFVQVTTNQGTSTQKFIKQ